MRRPTIVDVDRRAGVSVATVSRVIAGRPVADQELVVRVRSAAVELAYRPNTVARDFRLGLTSSIGVVVPDLANPFFPHVLKGLASEVSVGDYRLLVVYSREDPDEEIRLVEQLAGRCDGILLCSPRMSVANLGTAAGLGIPIICTNRSVDALPLGTIGIDSRAGMGEAIAHLHELGHRRIGYLAGPESSWSDQRRREGLAAAAAALAVEVHVTVAGSTSDAGFAALPELLGLGVTAIVAFNDLVAVGALSRLRELDVAVPRDLSVVGFDDIPFARLPRPAADHGHRPQGGAGPPGLGHAAPSDAGRADRGGAVAPVVPRRAPLHRSPAVNRATTAGGGRRVYAHCLRRPQVTKRDGGPTATLGRAARR